MEIKPIGTKQGIAETRPAPPPKGAEGKFVKAIEEIDKGEKFIDGVVRSAMRGKDFNVQELIAIQVGVYSYTQKLELFSKMVDRAASGIRQVLTPQ